jgi:hypothetical protein
MIPGRSAHDVHLCSMMLTLSPAVDERPGRQQVLQADLAHCLELPEDPRLREDHQGFEGTPAG